MLPQIGRRILRQKKPTHLAASRPPSTHVSSVRITTDAQGLSLKKSTQYSLPLASKNHDGHVLPGTSSTWTSKQYYHSTAPLGSDDSKTTHEYNKQLLKLTQQKVVNLQDMEDMFAHIEKETDIKLMEYTFFNMAKNCSKAGKASVVGAETVEVVMKWLVRFYQQKRLDKPPQAHTFGVLLQAWVKSRHPDCGKRVELLLNTTEDLVQKRALTFPIDIVFYNTTIQAYAVHGDVENAERIFGRCMAAYEQGNEKARPDAVSYCKLIQACAKANEPQRAEFWLEEMFKDYQSGNGSAKPNTESFMLVRDAWGKSDTVEATARYEKIVNDMNKLEGKNPGKVNYEYNRKLLGMTQEKPINFQEVEDLLATIKMTSNVILKEKTFFNMVKNIAANADIQGSEAAEAAEAIVFKWLVGFYEENRLDRPPDVKMFGLLLQAWVNTRHPDSGKRAEQVLEKLEALPNFPISNILYNKAVKAYAIHGDFENAQRIFGRCRADLEKGNNSARPSVINWNTLLDACAKSGTLEGAKHGEKVLDLMNKLAKEDALSARPDVTSYNSAINAWATLGKADNARQIFDRMLEDYIDGNKEAGANIISCGSMLKAYRNSEMFDAEEKAEAFLEIMKKLNLEPDRSAYVQVLQCWEKALERQNPFAEERIKELSTMINEL